MDSLIPEEFVGRCVASADMMCATTTIYPDASVVRGGVPLTADELRRKCATTTIYPDASVVRGGVPLTADELRRKYARQVDEYNALQKKRVREQKIAEAKKSPISRLLMWFKKACGSPVIEI